MRWRLILVAWVLAVLPVAASGASNTAGTGKDFGHFLTVAKRYCATAPARSCIDRLWPVADRNRDGVLELGEVQALDDDARVWAQTVDRSRRDPERDTTLVVLMVLKQAGLPQVFDRFDTDHDGALTPAELFADFKFDKRPFPKIVGDPSAVDWVTLGNRFGPIGTLLASLLDPKPPRHQPAPAPSR
jgi:hypothetical protein